MFGAPSSAGTPAPMDIGFSPAAGGEGGATGALSSLFGTTTEQGTAGKAPSSGIWAKIAQWLGKMDPEAMEKELKHIQQIMGGLNKVNSAAGESQIAQRLIKEGQNAAARPAGDGLARAYAPIPGGPTNLPMSGPNVTPEQASQMLRSMGLR